LSCFLVRSGHSFTCPACDAEVPANAKACPECGACEKSGWSGDGAYDGLELPDEPFDYDEFARKEFGSGAQSTGAQRWWRWVALLVLIALTWMLIAGRW
jgi:hypothetical protein